MPLFEYEKLTKENEALKSAQKSKEMISFEFRSDCIGMGFTRNSWNLITKDQLIIEIVKNMKCIEKEKNEIYSKLAEIINKQTEEKYRKKSWF